MSKDEDCKCSYCYKEIKNKKDSTVYCSNQCRDDELILQIHAIKDLIQYIILILNKLGIEVMRDN